MMSVILSARMAFELSRGLVVCGCPPKLMGGQGVTGTFQKHRQRH